MEKSFTLLFDLTLCLSTIAISLSSVGEANTLRKVSLVGGIDGVYPRTVKLGSFNPVLFNFMLSANISYFVYGIVLEDQYVAISSAANSVVFLYYIITIINLCDL